MYLTAAFMGVEIVAGLIFGSMALLADGVHMATHVGALGLAAWAYWMARRHATNRRFSFGSGKFGDLAGFASALVLGIVAIGVAVESVTRLYTPVPIQYREAIFVAALGLLVNIVSALMLHHDEDHEHEEATIATTISAPPMCMSWRTRRHRFWRLRHSAQARSSDWARSIPSSGYGRRRHRALVDSARAADRPGAAGLRG